MRCDAPCRRPQSGGSHSLASILVAVALAVSGLSAPAWSAGIGDVLRQAFASSSQIRAAAASLQAEKARLAQAQAERGPAIKLNSRYQGTHIRDAGASTDKATGSIFVEASQSLFDDGRLAAGISEAEARVAAAEARVHLAEQNLLLAAVDSYVSILEGDRLLDLAAASRRALEGELAAARNRLEVGTGTRTAVAQAESRFAEAETGFARRVGELEIARSRYEIAVGSPPPENLPHLAVLPELPRTLQEVLNAAIRDNPELLALRADKRAAEHALRRTGALQSGDGLSFFGSAGATHDSARMGAIRRTRPEVSAGFLFSVPLYDGGAKAARVQEAERRLDARRAEVMTSEGAVREEAIAAWESLVLAESVINSGRTRAEAAAIALEGVRRVAQTGQGSTLAILDGERELLDAETALVQAEFSRLTAAYRLRAAIGSLTLEALGL